MLGSLPGSRSCNSCHPWGHSSLPLCPLTQSSHLIHELHNIFYYISAMVWVFVSSWNLYVEILTPMGRVLGCGASRELTKVMKVYPPYMWFLHYYMYVCIILIKEGQETPLLFPPCEGTVKRQPSRKGFSPDTKSASLSSWTY